MQDEPKVVDETVEAPKGEKPSLAKVLEGISQLIMQGIYPATHAQLICEAVKVLDVLSKAEQSKETPKEEEKENGEQGN